MLYPNYNYYQPNQPTQARFNYVAPLLKGHPVSSFEEAKASSIDFDGTVFYFPDVANKKIYTKQINADGTSSICMYGQEELPSAASVSSSDYVTRDEFNETLTQIKSYLENLLVDNSKKSNEQVPSSETKNKVVSETAKQREFKF